MLSLFVFVEVGVVAFDEVVGVEVVVEVLWTLWEDEYLMGFGQAAEFVDVVVEVGDVEVVLDVLW